MYFADFAPYCYLDHRPASVFHIGWLDGEHAFTIGTTSQAFQQGLLRLCRSPSRGTRGFHYCEICSKSRPEQADYFGHVVESEGKALRLGSAEVWVASKDGVIYAAPDLIYHYVIDHAYLPPREFVDAVLDVS